MYLTSTAIRDNTYTFIAIVESFNLIPLQLLYFLKLCCFSKQKSLTTTYFKQYFEYRQLENGLA